MERRTREREDACLRSLRGLALGDAFGECFFYIAPKELVDCYLEQRPPEGKWVWTDDTAMALSIVAVLRSSGSINQSELARRFASSYSAEPWRGYGRGAKRLLAELAHGEDWRATASSLFGGEGSLGNGAAMRVGPLGAWFAIDGLEAVIEQARLSAEVTHTHPEGVAGAIAVAVAAALISEQPQISGTELLERVLAATPAGRTQTGIAVALKLHTADTPAAVKRLGAGEQATAPDTVPFTLWSTAQHLGDLRSALWNTAIAGGDIDTTCAIVGSLVALSSGASLPSELVSLQEPLPEWTLRSTNARELGDKP